MLPATVVPNGMTVNLNWLISVLKVVKKLDSSFNGWCQYPLEQSSTVMTVALDSFCAMSSGVQKQYGSLIMALFRLVRSKQMQSFGFPVLLSCDSTKMKLLIHEVDSWTGMITPAISILSISCLKVCLRWTGMGLQGVWLGVMDRFVWKWYGLPQNLPMPSKSYGYCSLICSFVLMILIFFGVSSLGIMGLEVAMLDWDLWWTSSMSCCCCVDLDCTCISFLG